MTSKHSAAETRSEIRRAIALEYREVVQSGQMAMGRVRRLLLLAGTCVMLGILMPRSVATAPPPSPSAELRGACYCRAMGQLNCVGVITQAECNKHCAEALCDDWFWMERLTCWNWGYGG